MLLGKEVKVDADACLQLIETTNNFVQSVTSSRDKCFSLSQRMRRAKIPLERIVSSPYCPPNVNETSLRHAIMDLRDCLENCSETTRKHGRRYLGRVVQWAFAASIKGDFGGCEEELVRCTSALEEIACKDTSSPQEPDLWSRRVLKGKGSKIRCISLVGRQLWYASKVLGVIDVDGANSPQVKEMTGGVIKCMLQIGRDGSMMSAAGVRELATSEVWTGHGDGKI
eukprot:CAMPEP_0173431084 /NCGR_PEP_ID=MMETSP1357-20121228/9323_1 /TAXON_ID=77926 /ORGANISM="Hemiselmis rufescens, Strain PCC563" /LENGTH=225 /DNA_ID=CAMNT_0014395511 /DNA_START=36 /DNA_END=710 /DNA_ORIENTATION=-